MKTGSDVKTVLQATFCSQDIRSNGGAVDVLWVLDGISELGRQTVLASRRATILSREQQREQKEQLERQVSGGACAV